MEIICACCQSSMKKTKTTSIFKRNNKIIMIDNLPVLRCINLQCQEEYLTEEVQEKLIATFDKSEEINENMLYIDYETININNIIFKKISIQDI